MVISPHIVWFIGQHPTRGYGVRIQLLVYLELFLTVNSNGNADDIQQFKGKEKGKKKKRRRQKHVFHKRVRVFIISKTDTSSDKGIRSQSQVWLQCKYLKIKSNYITVVHI